MTRRRAADIEGAHYVPYLDPPTWARAILAPLGVSPDDGLAIGDERFVATFGHFSVDVPRSQIDGAHRSGPWRWYTSVGARLSFADDGLTFGTHPDGGLCVHFDPPIAGVLPGRSRHSALSVSIAEPDAVIELLG